MRISAANHCEVAKHEIQLTHCNPGEKNLSEHCFESFRVHLTGWADMSEEFHFFYLQGNNAGVKQYFYLTYMQQKKKSMEIINS